MRLILSLTFTLAIANYGLGSLEGVIIDKALSTVFNAMDLQHPENSEKIKEHFLNSLLKHEKDGDLVEQFRSILNLFYAKGSVILKARIKFVLEIVDNMFPSELRTIFRSYKTSYELVGNAEEHPSAWQFPFDELAGGKKYQKNITQSDLTDSSASWLFQNTENNFYSEDENELTNTLDKSLSGGKRKKNKEGNRVLNVTVTPSISSFSKGDVLHTTKPKHKDTSLKFSQPNNDSLMEETLTNDHIQESTEGMQATEFETEKSTKLLPFSSSTPYEILGTSSKHLKSEGTEKLIFKSTANAQLEKSYYSEESKHVSPNNIKSSTSVMPQSDTENWEAKNRITSTPLLISEDSTYIQTNGPSWSLLSILNSSQSQTDSSDMPTSSPDKPLLSTLIKSLSQKGTKETGELQNSSPEIPLSFEPLIMTSQTKVDLQNSSSNKPLLTTLIASQSQTFQTAPSFVVDNKTLPIEVSSVENNFEKKRLILLSNTDTYWREEYTNTGLETSRTSPEAIMSTQQGPVDNVNENLGNLM